MNRLFISLSILVSVMGGCSADKPTPPRPADLVIIGVEPDRAPFVLRDSVSGSVTGFDVELFSTICQACRWRFEFRSLPNDSLQDALLNGEIDIAVGELSPAADSGPIKRSDPYYLTGLVMVVATAQPMPENGASWNGRMVAVPRDVPGNALAFTLKDAQVRAYGSPDSAAAEVEAGRVAALVADYAVARRVVVGRPGLQIIPGWLTTVYYTAAMRAADTARISRFNNALASLLGGYTYEQMHQKWFGYPLLNVAVPDSVSARWKIN
jgi:arginine/lysine/histidine/glutamine transport system substrate-binding/permease protein